LDTADITRLSIYCNTKYTEILDILDDNQKEILQKLNTVEAIKKLLKILKKEQNIYQILLINLY
jgi:hypothetical protein